MALNGTTFSSTALYECNDGFVVMGDNVKVHVCRNTAVWTVIIQSVHIHSMGRNSLGSNLSPDYDRNACYIISIF